MEIAAHRRALRSRAPKLYQRVPQEHDPVHDWEAMPILTVEYVVPASLFGSDRLANLFGRRPSTCRGRT